MSRDLRLGLWLALGGGREGLIRLVYMAVGVGLGIALLLLALTAPHALLGRSDRMAWQDAAYWVTSPEPHDDPALESVDGALYLAVSDYYDGRTMIRAYLAALGANPPIPPGLDRTPGPGEVAASPAMRRLLESTPDDELDDRFPGRVTLTIGPKGLAHDNELVAIIGRTPDQLRGVGSVAEVHGFAQVRPNDRTIVAFLAFFLLAGALQMLVPVVILIVVVTRVAWRQRERRLTAIRLVGATRTQIAVVAAAEAGLAAVGGAALGWALYEVGRRALAATVIFQGGHFWVEDVAVEPQWLAAILLGTPALVMLTTLVSLRHVQSRPLAVQRQARRRRPSLWLAAPLILGLVGLFAVVPFRDRLTATTEGERSLYPAITTLLTLSTIVGFVLIGPWLVALVGRGVARVSRSLPSLLAARRIAADPNATFYSVVAVGLATIGLTYVGCTVAVTSAPDGPGTSRLRPGVVSVMTGGVAEEAVAPLRSTEVVMARNGYRGLAVPCADMARMEYVTCPYGPESGFVEPVGDPTGSVLHLYIATDGSLAAENRVRTRVANLIPNAIINTDRDPIDHQLETFVRGFDRLGVVAAFFVVILGAFGLSAAMVGGLIERRRPFALLRTSGVHLGELRRALFLETAATMVLTSVAGAVVGMLLAYIASREAAMDWRWPGLDVFGLIGGGVLAALVFSTIALPLLSLTTRHDAVRFE